jgi:hypothetical protein
VREHQLALLLARPEDGDVALASNRPERSGRRARFGARSAAARTAKYQGELAVRTDAHAVRNAVAQGARIGYAQLASARCRILVRIGFEFVAEDGRGLVFDPEGCIVAFGRLDVGSRRAAD